MPNDPAADVGTGARWKGPKTPARPAPAAHPAGDASHAADGSVAS